MSRRILIIDDEEDITDSLKIGLERQGYSVDIYNDPLQALAHYKPGAYDLILLDIRMPRMNGFDVYREISKKDKGTKLYFLTAFEVYEDEFKKIFPALNIKYFLRKPISIAELSKHIKHELGE